MTVQAATIVRRAAHRRSTLHALWGGRPPSLPALVVAVLTAAFMASPLVYVLYRGATGGADTWKTLWDTRLPDLLQNTIQLAGAVALLTVIMGGGLAWLVVRTDVPLRGVWSWLLAVPLVVPPYVGAFVYIALLGPHGWLEDWTGGRLSFPEFYGFRGATLVLTLFTYPYVFLTTSAALRTFNPSLLDAAAANGASGARRFFTVTVPLARPALVAGGMLVVLYVLSDFGAVALLRENTFTLAIYRQLTGRFDRSAASALSSVLVLMTLVLLFSQTALQGRARYYQNATTWRPAPIVRLGIWRWPALMAVLLALTFALVLPIGALVYWSVEGLRDESTAAQIWRTSSGGLLEYTWHSLWSAGLAATATALLAVALASLRVRHAGPLSAVLEKTAQAGYALPGVVVALSVVFLLNNYVPALYGTVAAVIIAYMLRFFPQAYQSVHASFLQVSPNVEEAARTMGRPQWRATLETVVPLIAPGLLTGWALVFITALKELPATLLLRPAGFDTLPVRIWIQSSEGVFTLAAPAALALIACSLVPMLFLILRSRATAAPF
jgi:iron(III) transport system permease protein